MTIAVMHTNSVSRSWLIETFDLISFTEHYLSVVIRVYVKTLPVMLFAMVSLETHFMKNHESQSRTNESQSKSQ